MVAVAGRIRLVAVDIDGTLLDKTHVLTDHARVAKRLCDERGVVFTVATGRVSSSAEKVAKELEITAPVISNGGAAIKIPGGQYLRALVVPRDAVIRALTVARRHGVERYAYTCERYITETPGPHLESYSRGIGIPIYAVDDIADYVTEGTISLVFRTDRNMPGIDEKMQVLERELKATSRGAYRVNRSLPHMLEVLEPSASKGEALRALCALCGVRVEESMAIGDDFGDIDMLDAAGIGVLVANAAEHLKSPGRRVTQGCYAEGVLEAVRCYVVGER